MSPLEDLEHATKQETTILVAAYVTLCAALVDAPTHADADTGDGRYRTSRSTPDADKVDRAQVLREGVNRSEQEIADRPINHVHVRGVKDQ